MTRILALDLGTACGWALAFPGVYPIGLDSAGDIAAHHTSVKYNASKGGIQFGTLDLRAGRFSGGGMRFVRFEEELSRLLGMTDQVVFEEVRRHRGTDAAHVYGGLLAVLTKCCEQRSIPYEGVTVQAIKKFATGKGNGDKEAVIAAVKGWGFQPKNDNEADAIALLRLRLSETQPRDEPVSIPEGRRKVARGALERALS